MTLHVDDVTWTRSGRLVVDGVTVTPDEGCTVGILGPNGSGKSSLLRLVAGMDRPDRGRVLLDGTDLRDVGRRRVARRVALVDQHAHTDVDITVRDVVRLGRIPHRSLLAERPDEGVVTRAMTATGVLDMGSRSWHTLSGGERQRVQIARALAQEPDHLLLDEPTNHLDIAHQLDILAMVADLPITSYVALHDLNLASMFCDTIVVLASGRVVASGTPEDVLTEDLVRRVYDVDAVVTADGPGGRPAVRFVPRATLVARPTTPRSTR